MQWLHHIKDFRDRTPAFLRPLWSFPRAIWLGVKQLLIFKRIIEGRLFSTTGAASQIHLSWSQSPETTFTVTWWTPGKNNPAEIEYRQPAHTAWLVLQGRSERSPGITGWMHYVTVGSLDSDTHYVYRVSNDPEYGDEFSPNFHTRTAPAPGPADFRFVFVCDTGLIGREDGNADGTADVLKHLCESKPLFVLGAGDYAYANADYRFDTVGDAVDQWFDQYQPLLANVPIMAQYGNHEIFLRERYSDWAPRFMHPPGFDEQRNYSFRVANVFFCSLFVPGPPYPTSAQLDWLDTELASARADPDILWIVVFQHEPVYGHGTSHSANPDIRAALMPIFARHQVDLNLSGHDQSYERSFPLAGGPDHANIADSNSHNYTQGAGVIYAKISPGGKRSEIGQDFSRFTAPLPPVIAVADDTAHHYAVIDVKKEGCLTYSAYAVLAGEPPRLIDSLEIKARSTLD